MLPTEQAIAREMHLHGISYLQAVRKIQARERAMRSMEAANLVIGQMCANMLKGRDAFEGLE